MVVIAGVDGSDRSRDAIVLALRIAAVLEAQLLAVHVYPIDELAGYLAGGSLPEVGRLLNDAAEMAHARVRELASEMGVDEVRLRTASSAAAGLHASAVEEDTQLIVLGSSEQSGLDRAFPGPTAARLLSGSPVAVAVAPVGYADQPDSGAVGCGYDGSPAAREALQWAADFARRGRRPLQVLAVQRQLAFGHVGVTGAFGAKSANDELRAGLAADLAQAVAELPVESVESEILEGDPVQRLAEGSTGLALLVLGSRGYGPVRSVLLGSVSAGVARTAACPVLVVPSGVAQNRTTHFAKEDP
jgi:nucleotide-binding universal stress UspA family protein